MGFCVHVYFLFQLGKLKVILEHPMIKYVRQRLREQIDAVEEMCPRPVACCIITRLGMLLFYW